MSAGFEIDGEVFWGTNGSIEAYVQRLGSVAADLLGPGNSLTTFLRGQLEGFFPGIVIPLDDHLLDSAACQRFLRVLDESTQQMLHDDTFSELGRNWVGTVVAHLRHKVVQRGER